MALRDSTWDVPFLTGDGAQYLGRLATGTFYDAEASVEPAPDQFALRVRFNIIDVGGRSPLRVRFTIVDLNVPATPLRVRFTISESAAPGLRVHFNILDGGVVSRRLTGDVQAPVARVVLS